MIPKFCCTFTAINFLCKKHGCAPALYYLDQPLDTDGVQMVYDHPCEYNRLVPRPCFERETHEVYALGEIDTREAILLFNDRTRLTAENTIEYMI